MVLNGDPTPREKSLIYDAGGFFVQPAEWLPNGGDQRTPDPVSVTVTCGNGDAETGAESSLTVPSEIACWRRALIYSTILIVLTCLLLVLGKDQVKRALVWLENQDQWLVCILFVVLFTVVSFPLTWGYILLTLGCGYLFGLVRGLVVVVVAVMIGTTVAHFIIKHFLKDIVKNRLLYHEAITAILAVVGGHRALKVVFFTRLTPIPFGLQNAVFAVGIHLQY